MIHSLYICIKKTPAKPFLFVLDIVKNGQSSLALCDPIRDISLYGCVVTKTESGGVLSNGKTESNKCYLS